MKRKGDFDDEDSSEPLSKKRIFIAGTSYVKKMQVEGRKPFDQWFAAQTPEKQAQWVQAEAKRRASKKTKRKSTGKKGGGGKKARYTGGGGGGGGRGTNIIYPNVVGRGEYYLGGGFGYDPKEGWYGHARGHITDTVQGLGAYNVKRNSLMSAVDLGQDPPRVMNTNRGEATVINHREYLGDLLSGANDGSLSTPFSIQKYALNPGNQILFPFLSSIARNFQEYEIRGMLVELKSLSSEYSTNLALGSVFMAADYNVYGNDPVTKQQLENMEYASSAKPSKSMIMPIECDPSNNGGIHKNVAIDSTYHGGDQRLYDWCNLYIGSQGIPAASTNLAEIWLTYEIALFKPIIGNNEPIHPTTLWDAACFEMVNVTSLHPCGDTVVPMPTNSKGLEMRYTGSPATPYTQCTLDFPDLVVGHGDVYYQVNYVVSMETITGVVPSLISINTTGNGSVETVECWPVNGIASVAAEFQTSRTDVVGDVFSCAWSCIVKRTGANSGGNKSEGSMSFNASSLPVGAKSVGFLTVCTFPDGVIPL